MAAISLGLRVLQGSVDEIGMCVEKSTALFNILGKDSIYKGGLWHAPLGRLADQGVVVPGVLSEEAASRTRCRACLTSVAAFGLATARQIGSRKGLAGGNDSACEIVRRDAALPWRRQNRDDEEEAHADGRKEGRIRANTAPVKPLWQQPPMSWIMKLLPPSEALSSLPRQFP